ncbi:hypothetical protein [Rhodopseudomonas faecalis]|uniref:hypothetical protein n=1 Tax=Rhodopseudomonas faecalis TaxID=99655 RepID=UPI0011B5E72D|nr:hypothetical protein [Rhodopseudomonas faecalis]
MIGPSPIPATLRFRKRHDFGNDTPKADRSETTGFDTIMLANKPMGGNVNIGNVDLAAHVPTQELIVALSIL